MSDHPAIHHLAREERIRAIAYALWEEENRPEGRDELHWFKATELVDSEPTAEPGWLVREELAEEPQTSPLGELVKRMSAIRAA